MWARIHSAAACLHLNAAAHSAHSDIAVNHAELRSRDRMTIIVCTTFCLVHCCLWLLTSQSSVRGDPHWCRRVTEVTLTGAGEWPDLTLSGTVTVRKRNRVSKTDRCDAVVFLNRVLCFYLNCLSVPFKVYMS